MVFLLEFYPHYFRISAPLPTSKCMEEIQALVKNVILSKSTINTKRIIMMINYYRLKWGHFLFFILVKILVCFDGIQNDRDCPLGTHFSYYDNACVDPFLADCSLDYHMCQESVLTGLPVFIANSRDCRSYYVCVGENSVPLRCAPGQHFVPELNWCDSPEEANCTVRL